MTPTETLVAKLDEYAILCAADTEAILQLNAAARLTISKRLPTVSLAIDAALARTGNAELVAAVDLYRTRCQEHVAALLSMQADTTTTAANIITARVAIDTILEA